VNYPLFQNVSNTEISSTDFNPNSVPAFAHHLLRHYRANLGNWFSPLKSRKPLWSVLHLPIALSTVSELNIWGKANHARTTIFRTLLAVSAFTLDGTSSTYWREIGTRNKMVAQLEMKQCLMNELTGPTKAKYKDALLALLSLVSISVRSYASPYIEKKLTGRQVASGQFRDVRAYLGDAEKLICVRGISKRAKSRKAQILHYIFLFLRVIEESTYIYPQGENCDRTHELNMDDLLFPSIHLQPRGPNLNPVTRAEFELGLLSIVPNSPSLLMEIYGIPLSLFSLISRATSLANTLNPEVSIEADRLGDPERAKQIKKFENEICTWNIEDATIAEAGFMEQTIGVSPAHSGRTQHLILALHNALMLYFYRRIYNVNPWLLQSFVDKVLVHLQKVEQEKIELNILNTSIVWPGFLAAVEACGEDSRRMSLAWLRSNWQKSGWRSFESAANIAEEL
jgi:arginine metabolism regulation protein II